MSDAVEIKTGDSFFGGKYCDLYVKGKKYVGRASDKEGAIKAAELAVHIDHPNLQKPYKGLTD